jgi:dihydroneopterin aldolase
MDTIFIQQLKVETIIGVYKSERTDKQTVVLDIEMLYDCSQAQTTDNLKYALDYHQLSKDITAFVSTTSFQLIETLAQAIADLILGNKMVQQVKITLSKPQALDNAQNVGISILRKNDTIETE